MPGPIVGIQVAQPPNPVLQREHPLAQDISFAVCNLGYQSMDLVSNKFPSVISGTFPPAQMTQYGIGVLNTNVKLNYGRTEFDNCTFGTIFAIAGFTTNGTANIRLFSSGENGAGDGVELNFDDAIIATNCITLSGNNNSSAVPGSSDSLGTSAEGKLHVVMMSWSALSTKFYCNGVLTSTTTAFTANANASRVTKMFTNRDDSNTFAGQCVVLYAWNRVLSFNEYMQLFVDPYIFLRPQHRRFERYVNVPGVAAIEQTHYRWRADDGGLQAPIF